MTITLRRGTLELYTEDTQNVHKTVHKRSKSSQTETYRGSHSVGLSSLCFKIFDEGSYGKKVP